MKMRTDNFLNIPIEGFKEVFMIENSILHISISIGIAIYPEHGKNIEELMKSADIAMYKAKEEGKSKYVLYKESMNEENKTLIGQIISIGKSMGLCVIAEGVETKEQLDYLDQHKCDKIQGFYFCKPVQEDSIILLLEEGQRFKNNI